MKKTFYIQIIVVLVVVGAAIFSTPFLYDYFPDDYFRLSLINKWTQDKNNKPKIVIFGGSDSMSGINGQIIQSEMKSSVISYTNPAQTFPESSLFYSKVPEETKIVIQAISFGCLSGKEYGISSNKVNKLIIGDYHIDSVTRVFTGDSLAQLFAKNKYSACFGARSFIKAGLHVYIHNLLVPSLTKDSAYSKTYPYVYPVERAPESQYNKYPIPTDKPEKLEVSDIRKDKLRLMVDYFKSRGIDYYLVLMPVNPIMSNRIPTEYEEEVLNLSEYLGVKIFDCTYLLKDEDFYDPNHPNRAGAEKLTNYIVRSINNNRSFTL